MTKQKTSRSLKRAEPLYPLVSDPDMQLQLHTSKTTNWRLRKDLPQGIYWFKIGNRIFWNRDLMRDLWANNGDKNNPAHKMAVQKFLASLPSSAA